MLDVKSQAVSLSLRTLGILIGVRCDHEWCRYLQTQSAQPLVSAGWRPIVVCIFHLWKHGKQSPHLVAHVSWVHLSVLQVRLLGPLLVVFFSSRLSLLDSHSLSSFPENLVLGSPPMWPFLPQWCSRDTLTQRQELSFSSLYVVCKVSEGLHFGIPTSRCHILLLQARPGPDSWTGEAASSEGRGNTI